MRHNPKVSRDVLVDMIARLYKLLNDYISSSGSTEETDYFMHTVRRLLESEGFVIGRTK